MSVLFGQFTLQWLHFQDISKCLTFFLQFTIAGKQNIQSNESMNENWNYGILWPSIHPSINPFLPWTPLFPLRYHFNPFYVIGCKDVAEAVGMVELDKTLLHVALVMYRLRMHFLTLTSLVSLALSVFFILVDLNDGVEVVGVVEQGRTTFMLLL